MPTRRAVETTAAVLLNQHSLSLVGMRGRRRRTATALPTSSHAFTMATKKSCSNRAAEGIAGWAAVLGTVAVWDVWAIRRGHTTLSSAYAGATAHPVGKIVLALVDVMLLAHLWRWPRAAARFDPLGAAARALSGGTAGR